MSMASSTGTSVRELQPGFTSEADIANEATWCDLLNGFDDTNIYQTWQYDEVRCGRANLSHLVLRRNGEVVAAAQSRLVRLPVVNAGIAYVRWGPLWRRRGETPNPEIFRQAIRALRNEYASRRGLTVRIYPAVFEEDSVCFSSILNEEGFISVADGRADRTLLMDLSQPLPELRSGLKQHWHRYLKVAEKNHLEVLEGTDDNLFELFIHIYKEMVGRKRFSEPNDIYEFRRIQSRLPDGLKMKVMICKSGGEVCAGNICSAMGNTGVYLFGATSNAGLNSRGSYLLHWKVIEWLKAGGFAIYDLNGINPATNPGTYKFKSDLAGKNGRDVHFLGRFEARGSLLSSSSVICGDRLKSVYHRIRQIARV